MIRLLRQRHRRMVITLGIILPATFVVGIAARRPVPTVNELPAALAISSHKFEAIEWKRADLFAKTQVEVRLLREQIGAGRFAIGFSSAKDFVKPDLIVYWVAGRPEITGTMPGNAMLLGEFGSFVLPLPPDVAARSGVLVLYSLADNEIVDVSKPARFSDSTQ
ncbi:MAG: hypothetical protein WAO02_09475 [Verrucomicrobiia bacterium]